MAIFASEQVAFRIIDTARLVFPCEVSPATIIKSDFCNPPDLASIFSNPVGVPVSGLLPDRLSLIILYTFSIPSFIEKTVVLLDLNNEDMSSLTFCNIFNVFRFGI